MPFTLHARTCAFLLLTFTSTSALAAKGSIDIAIERGFAIDYSEMYAVETSESSETRTTVGHTRVGLATGLVSIPRIGVDYWFGERLSVGAAVTVQLSSESAEIEELNGVTTHDPDATSTIILLSPRIGYWLIDRDGIGVVIRGGVTWYSSGRNFRIAETAFYRELSGLNASLDPAVELRISPRAGLRFNLYGEIPLTGSFKSEKSEGASIVSTKEDVTIMAFGLGAGLFIRW
jgi:hypothetical protein